MPTARGGDKEKESKLNKLISKDQDDPYFLREYVEVLEDLASLSSSLLRLLENSPNASFSSEASSPLD